MVNVLDQYEPMYFQIDCFNYFLIWKFTSLVSLEREDSALSDTEVSKKNFQPKQKNGLRVVAPFRRQIHSYWKCYCGKRFSVFCQWTEPVRSSLLQLKLISVQRNKIVVDIACNEPYLITNKIFLHNRPASNINPLQVKTI